MKLLCEKTKLQLAGVYKITNNLNGKMYIGSTQCFEERYLKHCNLARRDKHTNDHLRHAFKKYGIENFTFEIVEVTILKDRFEREQYYIDTLGVLEDSVGYNISPTAKGMTEIPEYVRAKISKALKGKAKPTRDEEYKKWFTAHLKSIPKSEKHLNVIRENGLKYNRDSMMVKSVDELISLVKDYISGATIIDISKKYGLSKSAVSRIFQTPTPPLYKELLIKIGFEGDSIKDLRKPEVQAKLKLTQD